MIISRTSMFHDWVVGKIINTGAYDCALFGFSVLFTNYNDQDVYQIMNITNTASQTLEHTGCIVLALYKEGLRTSLPDIDALYRSDTYTPGVSRMFTIEEIAPMDIVDSVASITREQYLDIAAGGNGPTATGNRTEWVRKLASLQWSLNHPDIHFVVVNIHAPIYAGLTYGPSRFGVVYYDLHLGAQYPTAYLSNQLSQKYFDRTNGIRCGVKLNRTLSVKASDPGTKTLAFGYEGLDFELSSIFKLNFVYGNASLDSGPQTATVTNLVIAAEFGHVNPAMIDVDIYGCVDETWTVTASNGRFVVTGAACGDVGSFAINEVFEPVNPYGLQYDFPGQYYPEVYFLKINIGAITGLWTDGDKFTFKTNTTVSLPFGCIGTELRSGQLVYEYDGKDINGIEQLTGWYTYLGRMDATERNTTHTLIRDVIQNHLKNDVDDLPFSFNRYMTCVYTGPTVPTGYQPPNPVCPPEEPGLP